MTIDAVDPDCFWGRIAHLDLNSVRMAEVSSGAAAVSHSALQASHTPSGSFHLLLQLSGHSVFSQDGKEARLVPGDITLMDCARPYELVFVEQVSNFVLTVTRDHLKTYFACPEALAAVRLPGDGGPSALASRFLRELWSRPEDLVAGCASPFLDRAVLDMVATAYSSISKEAARASPHSMTRRVALINYIERHLTDAELSVETIATAFRVTPRCIYRIFDSESETLARYIRRRRLEESARALSNPLQRTRSISSIAYDNGFSSIAHFSKLFREHYHQAPSEYRQSALG